MDKVYMLYGKNKDILATFSLEEWIYYVTSANEITEYSDMLPWRISNYDRSCHHNLELGHYAWNIRNLSAFQKMLIDIELHKEVLK